MIYKKINCLGMTSFTQIYKNKYKKRLILVDNWYSASLHSCEWIFFNIVLFHSEEITPNILIEPLRLLILWIWLQCFSIKFTRHSIFSHDIIKCANLRNTISNMFIRYSCFWACILICCPRRLALYVNCVYSIIVHTVTVVTFKLEVYTVNAGHSTKIHFPPRCFVRITVTYWIRPHTSRRVSINCVTSFVTLGIINVWLGGNFVVGYII